MFESPSSISKILVDAYHNCDYFSSLLIRFRPYICPFHELIKHVPVNSSLLDVGCGVGLMTVILAQLGKIKRGIGIDISQKVIDTACAAVIPPICKVSFQCLSMNDPWPDEDFDTIVCVDVLHHIPHREQHGFIKKLACVGQRSRIIFKDISPRPFWKALASMMHDLLLSQQWINIRSEDTVKKWFQEEGFTVVEQRRLDMLWYSHYLLVAEKKMLF